ncbi:MAG: dihydrolipoamide acetyltransferase family protein [Gammaproteobacteria bacterium]|jgi:pyruvate dehydrogenase E2 component (dihydrolipoamide acetyltransferase)|nr:2-oxo acid dehydrogenase subunit E2 [Gammaproteobacteria bacterium]
MTIFKLPDLGEGLPDAEIHEWFVKIGDHVNVDDPLVSMETAKAVVEVPSPQAGKIAVLHGNAGDVIKTGDALVTFETDAPRADQGTVVGNLEVSTIVSEDIFTIGSSQAQSSGIKTTPTIRHLAKKLGVNLNKVSGSGEHGVITQKDVEQAAHALAQPPEGFEPLHGVRRAMQQSMLKSHQEVVPVSIFDEVDIQHWPHDTDITVRLIRAIIAGIQAEPALNAWFDTQHCARKCFSELSLGLAMDTPEGLFVPVIHQAEKMTEQQLREQIDAFKRSVVDRSIPKEQLQGSTLTLSNFGKFAGKFASPIIVPPTVAILAVGRLYEGAVSHHGEIAAHRLLPLSLSFDHRAVTGGEATRFLGAVMTALQK